MQSEAFDRYLRLLISEPTNVQRLEDIAIMKVREPKLALVSLSGATLVEVFPNLGGLGGLEAREEIFVSEMENGTLLAV